MLSLIEVRKVFLTSRITGVGVFALGVLAVAGVVCGIDVLAPKVRPDWATLSVINRAIQIAIGLLTGAVLGILTHLVVARINGELFYRYAKTVDWAFESDESIHKAIFRLRHGGREWDPLTRELECMLAVKRDVHSDPTQ